MAAVTSCANAVSGAMQLSLYDPGQAGRDAYRDPARNTNSKECLYDPATYPA
jgi:hypothetical protein